MPPKRRNRLVTEIAKFRKNLIQAIENFGRRLQSPLRITLEILVAIAVIGSMCFAGCQAILQQQQLRLENAPQIALHNVIWWYTPGDNWFGSQMELQNYGVKPALEFRFLNFRAIVFEVDEGRIRTDVQARTDPSLHQHLDLYVQDTRNQLILALLEKMASFFRQRPLANREVVQQFLQEELQANLYIRNPIINGDMDIYRARQRRIIVPNHPATDGLGQQLDHTVVERTLTGNNLLVVYWAFAYEGTDHNAYQSFYIGYGDRNFSTKFQLPARGDRVFATLTEFQSWWAERNGEWFHFQNPYRVRKGQVRVDG